MHKIIAASALLAGLAGALEAGEAIKVPSGQAVTYVDTVRDTTGPAGLTYRFRFLAPGIARKGGTVTADAAEADMQALCDTFALPRLPEGGPLPEEIVISLSDRPVSFGEPAPDATQYFEAYRPEGKTCVWQGF